MMDYKKYLSVVTLLLTVSLTCLSAGCGGGSRGTGNLTIEGRVINVQGQPVGGADVTNLETGENAVTSSDGAFTLITEKFDGDVSFIIETQALQVTSRGGQAVSDDVEVIEVVITVDTSSSVPSARQDVTIKKKKSGSSSSASSASSKGSSSSASSKSSSGGSTDDDNDDNDDSEGGSNDDDGGQNSSQSSSSSSSSSSSGDDDSGEVRVQGAIESITSATITVSGTTYTIDGQTRYDGKDALTDFRVGDEVEVRGRFKNGVLFAQRIRFND